MFLVSIATSVFGKLEPYYVAYRWQGQGGTIIIAASVGALFFYREGTGIRALFAGIAALAMPHLLVTPWFEGRMRFCTMTMGKGRVTLSS